MNNHIQSALPFSTSVLRYRVFLPEQLAALGVFLQYLFPILQSFRRALSPRTSNLSSLETVSSFSARRSSRKAIQVAQYQPLSPLNPAITGLVYSEPSRPRFHFYEFAELPKRIHGFTVVGPCHPWGFDECPRPFQIEVLFPFFGRRPSDPFLSTYTLGPPIV